MATPNDTLHAIKGAATVNSAALASIKSEIPAWQAAIALWNPTPSKGLVRDQLARVAAAYQAAKDAADKLELMAQLAIDQIGTGGDPDTLPPSVPWSTGELQIAFGVGRRPNAGMELGRYLAVENVDWDATLCAAVCDVASTAQADVTFWLNGAPAIIFRFMPGALEAAVIVLIDETAPGDVLIVTAPAIADLTLSGISGTAVGRRRGT